MAMTESVMIKVLAGTSKYLECRNPEIELTRNALLLYPYAELKTFKELKRGESA